MKRFKQWPSPQRPLDALMAFWLRCINTPCTLFVLCGLLVGTGTVRADMTPQERLAMQEWERQRDDKVIKQKHPYSCGAASLANLMTYFHDRPVGEDQLLSSIGHTGEKVSTMLDLVQMAKKADFPLTGYRAPKAALLALGRPAIVRIQEEPMQERGKTEPNDESAQARRESYQHFVVLVKVENDYAYVKDPVEGNRKILFQRFVRMWEDRPGEGKGALLTVAQ